MLSFARACATRVAESSSIQAEKEHRMEKWVYRFEEVDEAEE